MHIATLAAVLASGLTLAAAASAQTPSAPTPSSPAASPATPPKPANPAAPATATPPPAMPSGSVTRDQYIQQAQERAARAAGNRFDRMDANHDGILTPEEVKTYRAAHPRRRSGQQDE
ncbi:MAG TPA: hypothetical protein VFA12_17315 [Stellaceae bacterium]|nr:hypothetical protein [Stellaceae bacterium]